ncbi:Hypothetical protein D9617_48g089390 [Elsinoe fawcettii]|nr:Hypothetical protein D9617_48g089390 [Elsinoe fawcettii]
MAPMDFLIADWKFLEAPNVTAGAHIFLSARNPVWDYVTNHANNFMSWISRPGEPPQILLLITVWWTTFAIVVTIGLCLGFGPSGVVAGSFAAAFQAWAYGAFTPAGGVFATLTSLGMVGVLAPAIATAGASVATITVWIVWSGQKI